MRNRAWFIVRLFKIVIHDINSKGQRNDVTNIKSNIKTMLSSSCYVLTKKMLLPADLFSLTTSCQVLVKQTKSGLEELQQSSPESFHNTFEVFWELPYRHLLV